MGISLKSVEVSKLVDGFLLVLMRLALSILWKAPVLTSLRLLSTAQAPILRSTSSRLLYSSTQANLRGCDQYVLSVS